MAGNKNSGKASASTVHRAKVINRILAQRDRMPLDVMMDTMDLFYSKGQELLYDAQLADNKEEREMLERQGMMKCVEACAIAEKAAPYIHSKLQMLAVNNSGASPVQIQNISIKGMSHDDLEAMKQLILKNSPKKLAEPVGNVVDGELA